MRADGSNFAHRHAETFDDKDLAVACVSAWNDFMIDDPDNYTAPKAPTPPAKGSYKAKLTRWAEDTDRSTGALKNPYTIVASFEITEGPSEGRRLLARRAWKKAPITRR